METANIVISLSINGGPNTITISLPHSGVDLIWEIAVASARLATALSQEKMTGRKSSRRKL